jgi:phosphohistidine swiveling domain-containing protein
MPTYTIDLDRKSALEEKRVGGKGSGLAWLRRQRFRVPEGFVITVDAFHDFLSEFGIELLGQNRDWTEGELEHIREMLTACRIPGRVSEAIATAYHQLGGAVAVRSSMIGEDTQMASFAGQLDTVLSVEGEDQVIDAVKGCWTSMFSWRLFKYLSEKSDLSSNSPVDRLSIAVVVQRMVDARAAGVAFSADPLTGQPCVIIEAVHGLGERLVQGLAKPDRYVVDTRGVVCESTAVDPDKPVLSKSQILELSEVIRQVARRTNTPQDIEWASDDTGLYVLQRRPITTLVGKHVYSAGTMSEMLPGLIKPLVWSVSSKAVLENVFARIFTELLGPNDVDYSALCRRVHSRVYIDTTLLGQVLERLGLPANTFESMSRGERARRHQRMPLNRKTLRTMFRLLRFLLRHSRAAGDIDRYLRRHDHELDAYRRVDLSIQDPRSLLDRLDQLLDLYSETMWFNFVGPMNMLVRNKMLESMVAKHAPDVVPSDLVRGLVGLKSLESNRELQSLAAKARALGDQTCELLMGQGDREIRTQLSRTVSGQSLIADVDTFLDRYGFLSAAGTDLSRTPWIENPTMIWHTIGRLANAPDKLAPRNMDAIREDARVRVRSGLGWYLRPFFDLLHRSTVTYIGLRERSSFMISEDSFEIRRILLALSEQLYARGDLGRREDVFCLTLDELHQSVEGTVENGMARKWASERRAEMEADALLELPETFCGDMVPTSPIQAGKDREYLSGISGSAGRAEGYARIVLDPAEAPARLRADDILVVPFSDVSWTPLFAGVGGVIAETGGQLSHSAIVAREYGLPAVVNVKHATRLIHDGQFVTVDGNKGQVWLR